jgi:hypothetical protein
VHLAQRLVDFLDTCRLLLARLRDVGDEPGNGFDRLDDLVQRAARRFTNSTPWRTSPFDASSNP